MTVPTKTFTGLAGLKLSGTNGAGTVNGGGIQRDLLTLFAMFNPETTRPDGETGGIKVENFADIGLIAKFYDSNWLAGSAQSPDSTPDMSDADEDSVFYKAFTFGAALDSIDPPYRVEVWTATDSSGTNMAQVVDPGVKTMAVSGFQIKVKVAVKTSSSTATSYSSYPSFTDTDTYTSTTRTVVTHSVEASSQYNYVLTTTTTVYTLTAFYSGYFRIIAYKVL
jgi:hypothetical protein